MPIKIRGTISSSLQTLKHRPLELLVSLRALRLGLRTHYQLPLHIQLRLSPLHLTQMEGKPRHQQTQLFTEEGVIWPRVNRAFCIHFSPCIAKYVQFLFSHHRSTLTFLEVSSPVTEYVQVQILYILFRSSSFLYSTIVLR